MTVPCPACGPDLMRWLSEDPARQHAWQSLPRRWVEVGEVLQAAGQSVRAVWFVERGLLRSHFLSADGRERNCGFHPEWQWAGMPPPRDATATSACAIDALERCHVVELSHAALTAWLQQRPELQLTLTDALLVNLMSASRRESTLLLDSAEQRYIRFLAEHPDIAERVALHHVASYLGITSVALSRVRRRIKERDTTRALSGPTESGRLTALAPRRVRGSG